MLEIVGGIVVLAILILLSGLKTVKEHHQLVIYRYGRVADCKGPGLHLIMPIIDHIEMVETRLRTPPRRSMQCLSLVIVFTMLPMPKRQ